MKIILISIFILTLVGCREHSKLDSIPEIFRTNYSKYKDKKFDLQFGDLVQVRDSAFKGIICDISEEEDGVWYGIVFLDKQGRLFGRSIPNGFSNGCIKLFDFTYLNQEGISSITKISTIKLEYAKIGIGSRSAAMDVHDLIGDYWKGIERRKHTETPCEEKSRTFEPINENYIDMKEILED